MQNAHLPSRDDMQLLGDECTINQLTIRIPHSNYISPDQQEILRRCLLRNIPVDMYALFVDYPTNWDSEFAKVKVDFWLGAIRSGYNQRQLNQMKDLEQFAQSIDVLRTYFRIVRIVRHCFRQFHALQGVRINRGNAHRNIQFVASGLNGDDETLTSDMVNQEIDRRALARHAHSYPICSAHNRDIHFNQ